MNELSVYSNQASRAAPIVDVSMVAAPQRRVAISAPEVPMPRARHDAAPPREVHATLEKLNALIDEALTSGDPQVLMMAVASRVRDGALEGASTATEIYSTTQHVEMQAQIRAFDDAKRAQANAAQWNTVARIGAYVGAALSIVVGLVAAVYSGGSSIVAGVGLALVLVSAAATLTVMAVQDADPHHTPPPKWLTIAIAIVALIGAAMSAGAGASSAATMTGAAISATAQSVEIGSQIAVECKWIQDPPPWFHITLAVINVAGCVVGAAGSASGASSAASGAAEAAAKTATQVQRVAEMVHAVGEGVRGAVMGVQGGANMIAAVETHNADNSTREADHHRDERRRNADRVSDTVEAMKAVMKAFRQVADQATSMGQQINDARHAVLGNFVRA